MKKLTKVKIMISAVCVVLFILYSALFIPYIGKEKERNMTSRTTITLTSEEMICYDIEDVSVPVGLNEPFSTEKRYYIRPISEENAVIGSYSTTTPFNLNEIFTRYTISLRIPGGFDSEGLNEHFYFYDATEKELYRTQAIDEAEDYIYKSIKEKQKAFFIVGLIFAVCFISSNWLSNWNLLFEVEEDTNEN